MSPTRQNTILAYVGFPLGVVLIGALIGSSTGPGPGYQALEKPWFTPPGWLFGPVWTVLYLLIGWVGARKWLHGGQRGLWALQMLLNFAWSPVFFGLERPRAALLVILAMLFTIALFIIREWRRDPLSARLLLPYVVWVTIATSLNAGIVLLNPGLRG